MRIPEVLQDFYHMIIVEMQTVNPYVKRELKLLLGP